MTKTIRCVMRAVLAALLLTAIASWAGYNPWAGAYSLFRQREQARALASISNLNKYEGVYATVHFPEGEEEDAAIVLATAEDYLPVVARDLGYLPPGKVPIILHPEPESLRRTFGWAAGEDAVGVYWNGVIRVLGPRAWVGDVPARERERLYREIGPMAHELTHYILDYRTGGNYPRWFTEGLAQFEEWRITGYQWLEPESDLTQRLYTLRELDSDFDRLSNLALSYRQSFLLVVYISERWGDEGLNSLVDGLANGEGMQEALRRVTGGGYRELEAGWRDWLETTPRR